MHVNRSTQAVAARLEEARYLLAFGRASNSEWTVHLQSEFSIANYIRIADEVAQLALSLVRNTDTARAPEVLDWGAGFGQLSYLLAGRGCAVSSYDVGDPGVYPLPINPGQSIRRDSHPSRLPFADDSFDVLVSCGVLEHVPHEDDSLDEIRRVVMPGGLFLIFNLPQRLGYTEYIVRAFKLGYTHERRYSGSSVRRQLSRHGFAVRTVRRSNMLPHNFRGLPARARAILTHRADDLLRADLALSSIPVLNRISGILEIVAVRGDR